MVEKAVARGVKIGLGTDAGVYPHGRNAEEFGLLVKHGMRNADALRAGTSVDAELLGIANKTGTLEARQTGGHRRGARESHAGYPCDGESEIRDEGRDGVPQ